MSTSLGGSQGAGFRLAVYNGSAETIKRGIAVSWVSIAAGNPAVSFLDTGAPVDYGAAGTNPTIPYISVRKAIADAATPGTTAALGVATADILPGQFGEIQTYGLVPVLCDATPAAGTVISNDGNGEAIDAAAASHDNPWGILLEVGVANTLKWAFVNFIGSATGCSAAGFSGRAY
jgi:hypothetical protein